VAVWGVTIAFGQAVPGVKTYPAGGVRVTRPGVGAVAAGGAAAAAEGGKEGEVVKVRKIVGLGAASKVKTPEYRSTVARGPTPPKDWVQISVSYDTYPEWMDELTIRYYAMAYKEERGKKIYSLYKNTERCLDVAAGRGHASVMYLRPAAIERYGELVAVAAEIVYQGKVVGEVSEVSGTIPEDWWKNENVIGKTDLVTSRDGYLVERTRSPFVFINTSEYEYTPF
jgi:hypothetical protein